MKNFSRGDRRGGYGGRRTGGFVPAWKRAEGGYDRPELHGATCNKCGKACQVPFRPTGVRPVFCRDCFKKDEGLEPKRFGEKRPFSRPFARPQGADRGIPLRQGYEGRVEERLKAIEAKIDAIIEAIGAE